MFRWIIFSAWIWGYILARYIIWSHRWEGIKWYPNPNASSWYALTDLKLKPRKNYLFPICLLSHLMMLAAIISIPENIPLLLALLFVHIITSLWWPAFIELKYSFRTCFFLAASSHICTIYILLWFITRLGANMFCLFPILLILIQSWMVWISGYAWIVCKEPTLLLEYTRRQSRNLLTV